MDPTPCCANCVWWRRYSDGSSTGVCTNVTLNDYSRASLQTESGRDPERFIVLATDEDFSCADHAESP